MIGALYTVAVIVTVVVVGTYVLQAAILLLRVVLWLIANVGFPLLCLLLWLVLLPLNWRSGMDAMRDALRERERG